MIPVHRFLLGMAICGLTPWLAAETVVPNGTEAASTVGLNPAFVGLTPAQAAEAQALLDEIRTEHGVILPNDLSLKNINDQAQAQRFQEALTYLDHQQAFSGRDATTSAAEIWTAGGYSLQGQFVQGSRHLRPSRYLWNATADFDVVDANDNLLDDFNQRLNRLSNKIEKSKFACGQFDWVVQLKGKFNKEALEKYVDNLAESALAAAPMAFLANWSPTLYEIVKWLRAYAGAELDTEKVQCQQIEAALTNMGQRMVRGDGYPECIKANQALGVSEAHRLCNSNNSPFDGVENVAGQIVGIRADPQSINLTQAISDRLRTAKDSGDVAAQRRVDEAQAAFDAASAALTASPDPGPKPPGPDGSAAMQSWYAQKAKYNAALAQYNEWAAKVTEAQGVYDQNASNAGVWGKLGNALADNLGLIIGDIDLSGRANVQFGRQRQYALMLRYRRFMYEHALDFTEQLQVHYNILTDPSPSLVDLRESYRRLQAFTFGTMQGPWLDDKPWVVNGETNSDQVACSFSTLDKLAVLWTEHLNADANGIPKTVWPEKYRMVECINQISNFELLDYLVGRAERDTDTIISEFQSHPSIQNGGEAILNHAISSMNEYKAFLERRRASGIPTLVACLHAVNSFPLTRNALPTEEAGRLRRPVERTYPQLGR